MIWHNDYWKLLQSAEIKVVILERSFPGSFIHWPKLRYYIARRLRKKYCTILQKTIHVRSSGTLSKWRLLHGRKNWYFAVMCSKRRSWKFTMAVVPFQAWNLNSEQRFQWLMPVIDAVANRSSHRTNRFTTASHSLLPYTGHLTGDWYLFPMIIGCWFIHD